MHTSIAEVIRGFSQVVAYNENADPIYKTLKTKNLSAGFPSLNTLVDSRISGWKMQKNKDGEEMFTQLKGHIEKDAAEPALTFYEEKIIPFLKKQHGAKI